MGYKLGRAFYETTNSIYQLMVNFEFMHKQCLKLGRIECALLSYLMKQKCPVSMKNLAEYIDVSGSRMTHLIDGLVEKGYVMRVNKPNNRRTLFAEITPQGIEIAKKYNARNVKMFNNFLSKLPPEDIEPIYNALDYWCGFLTEVNKRLAKKKRGKDNE